MQPILGDLGAWELIQENAYTLAMIPVNNKVLCLCPRSLISSASIHETGRGG